MSIEQKLSHVHHWNKQNALECWTRFHELYAKKYSGALFNAIKDGDLDKYVRRESETFRRYASMWYCSKVRS